MSKMLKIEGMVDAIHNGNLSYKVFNYITRKTKFAIVRNDNLLNLCKQDYYYNKLKKDSKELLIDNYSGKQKNFSSKVWILWLQGIENAPPLVRACINSAKCNLLDHEVIILSEKNVWQYVDFPKGIKDKIKHSVIPFAQLSDLIRLDILSRYGGLWLDATVFVTGRGYDYNAIVNSPLFVYKEVELLSKTKMPIIASNWLIHSTSNNPILLKTRELLFNYWEHNNFLVDYFIFHYFFHMSAELYPVEWEKIPTFCNRTPHIMQFELSHKYTENRWKELVSMSSFHKLNRYIEQKKETDSNLDHIIKCLGEI